MQLPKKRKMVVQRRQRTLPTAPGQAWSMDFVAEEFSHGGKFRILTVVDVFTREALAVHAWQPRHQRKRPAKSC
jgi:putative transposase